MVLQSFITRFAVLAARISRSESLIPSFGASELIASSKISSDDLVEAFYINKGLDYYEANLQPNQELFDRADNLMERIMQRLEQL